VGVPLSAAGPRGATAIGAALERYALPLLIVVQIAALILAVPRGDFPLNDDWAYAHSVRWLLDEHRIRLSDWIAMNLVPQTLLGAAAALVAGYSFATLRHVTQLVSLAVVALVFLWFEAAGMRRRDAFVATLVIIACPVWIPLSNTYMTDLYGLLFGLPAATLFLRALERPATATLAAATAIATIGMLERQVLIVLPAAFLVATLFSTWPWRLSVLLRAAAPTAIVMAVELGYRAYLVHGPGLPQAQVTTLGYYFAALGRLLTNENDYLRWVGPILVQIPCYVGLFAAPWLAWVGFGDDRSGRRLVLLATAAIAAAMFVLGWFPPWRADLVIDAAGIGPFTLYDAQPRGLAAIDRSPGVVWRLAAIAAAFGVAALVRVLARATVRVVRRDAPRRARDAFLLALVAAYYLPFMITGYIDRYLLFALPFVFALAVPREAPAPAIVDRFARGAAVVWIAVVIPLAVAATHDYFAWNRARWAAIAAATSLGGTPDTIDGGFEYNGYFRFEKKPRDVPAGKSWWWVKDDRWVVAFGPVPGYAERARFTVERWLSRTPSTVYLLERV
jgi:hypothetical protein